MKRGIIEGTNKSAINRTNMKESVFNVINGSEKPISTSEIANILKKSWHTVIRYCFDLENENKITKFEIGRMNIWQIKKR